MEEEDQDELLQCTDDESLSENEDQCLPINQPEENYRHTLVFFNHTKLEFITTKILLVLSTTMILILLPLYMESINVSSDVYTMMMTSTAISTIIFVSLLMAIKAFCGRYCAIELHNLPLKFSKFLKLSVIYVICAFAVVYALDRKRVLCHLQDPIKGIVLVISLLYYFFFCRKLMGLQRIFSATTIIVGLFIAVDYGLCDEFRCRGYERERISDDTGHWIWQVHSVWTTIYIFGLALFAGYIAQFESCLLTIYDSESAPVGLSTSLLSTVSRSVSHPTNNGFINGVLSENRSQENGHLCQKHSALHLAMWLHVFSFIIMIMLFWTDLVPEIGKATTVYEFLNYTTNGLMCHFEFFNPDCGNILIFGWSFIISYSLFVVVSIKFLILCQSAVYTVATMTTALPIIGIWWSLVHMTPSTSGLLVWAPSVTGELICSLLGLPIILIGLCLLCKSHLKDYQWSKLAASHAMPSNHLA